MGSTSCIRRRQGRLMLALTFIINSILCLIFSRMGSASTPDCRCVHFDNGYQRMRDYGVFTSPNWPFTYNSSMDESDSSCLVYIFEAPSHQIVQISLDSLDLPKPTSTSPSRSRQDCSSGDYLKLFLQRRSSSDVVICGKSIPDSLVTHYSRSSSLVVEYVRQSNPSLTTSNQMPSGFAGTYKFLNKSDFESDGEKLSGTFCDYEFLSIQTSSTSSTTVKREGKFFSPGFPSPFDPDVRCAYHFMGKYNEKVKVIFEKIDLGNDDLSCLDSSDSIIVYDGRSSESPIIAQLCNNNRFVNVISTGPDLYILFVSSSTSTSTSFSQGFQGKYFFFSPESPSSPSSPSSRPPSIGGGKTFTQPDRRLKTTTQDVIPSSLQIPGTEPEAGDKEETGRSVKTTSNFSCDLDISSDSSKTGVISSPNFPSAYPESISCSILLTGSGKERVQISFSDFDLYSPPDDSRLIRDCEVVDSILIVVFINGNKERLDNLCGQTMPSSLMSNGPTMKMEFKTFPRLSSSLSRSTPSTPSNGSNWRSQNFRGFRATYNFITNFGISGGFQDSQRGVCAFVYNSTASSKNGSFTSPNWPGVYPRNTECHYLFFGQPNERVYFEFTHFDVEGVPPCSADSASDYLEFSNYQTIDRKMQRHCGVKKPTKITSDQEFFRVIFKSNDRFDGTGFQATYRFSLVNLHPTNKVVVEKSGAHRMSSSLRTGISSRNGNLFIFLSLLTSLIWGNSLDSPRWR